MPPQRDLYRVKSDGLNLRSKPVTLPRTRLAVLHTGEAVRKVGTAADPAWWEIEAIVGGKKVRGYVAHKFLVREADHAAPAPASGMRPAMLAENRPGVTRDARGSAYAYPIGEASRPARAGATPAARARSLGAIIKWLGVDTRTRYQPQGSTTYCNIYAADYCYLAGTYLPRVWWTGKALERIARGEPVAAVYNSTVVEITANQLYRWLSEYGPELGWIRTVSADELQNAVNSGSVGIICAQRTDLNRPGHISVVAPERGQWKATRNSQGAVTIPLQSMAGISCYQYGCRSPAWWTGAKYGAFGFWVHA